MDRLTMRTYPQNPDILNFDGGVPIDFGRIAIHFYALTTAMNLIGGVNPHVRPWSSTKLF